jgi:calcium-binding protein CML
MGGAMGKGESPKKFWVAETKLEAKMVEAMQRRECQGCSMKSFNTIILKFPKIDESFRKCRAIFEQFGRFLLQIYASVKLVLCFNIVSNRSLI